MKRLIALLCVIHPLLTIPGPCTSILTILTACMPCMCTKNKDLRIDAALCAARSGQVISQECHNYRHNDNDSYTKIETPREIVIKDNRITIENATFNQAEKTASLSCWVRLGKGAMPKEYPIEIKFGRTVTTKLDDDMLLKFKVSLINIRSENDIAMTPFADSDSVETIK